MRAMFQHPKTRGPRSAGDDRQSHQFDKRGTGLSDRVKELPSHEQRMDDLRVVLDACGSKNAVLIGSSEGGALAMLYAATYPERVRGLVLCGAFARMTKTGDYPYGYAPEEMEKLKGYIRGAWGKGASLRAIAPSELQRPGVRRLGRVRGARGDEPGQRTRPPGDEHSHRPARALPAIRVPTAVLQAAEDKMIDPASGPYLAEHIPNARYVEAAGDDHVFFFRNQHEIVDAVRWLLEQDPPQPEDDRFLSTVLVTHTHGDHDEAPGSTEVQRFRGQAVASKRQAYFDGPIRAIRCGLALADGAGLRLACTPARSFDGAPKSAARPSRSRRRWRRRRPREGLGVPCAGRLSCPEATFSSRTPATVSLVEGREIAMLSVQVKS